MRKQVSLWVVAHVIGGAAYSCAGQSATTDTGPPFPSGQVVSCHVSRISDGDTFACEAGYRVRLIGIDTPELNQEPYGRSAADALAEMIPVGSTVYLELGLEERDRYDRVLAHVWRDSSLINWELVKQGYAVTLTYPPNVRYVDWLTGAQELARTNRSGLWAVDGFGCLPLDRRRGRCD